MMIVCMVSMSALSIFLLHLVFDLTFLKLISVVIAILGLGSVLNMYWVIVLEKFGRGKDERKTNQG